MPISVFGDGEQTRDFVYIDDLVGVLVQALNAASVEVGPVNVGLNQATTLLQLLHAIGEVLDGLPEIAHLPARAGDIRHSRADNARLLRRYGLERTTSMLTGLGRLLGR